LNGGKMLSKDKKIAVIMLSVLVGIQLWILMEISGNGYVAYIPNVAGMMVLWIAYTAIEVKYNLYMHHYVRLVTMLATVGDNYIGHYLNYYLTSTIFDKGLHAFGTYSLALFSYVLVAQIVHMPIQRVFRFIVVFSLGVSIGAIYEIGEFAADQWLKPVRPSQPSLWDTDLDLICDVLGAALAGIHIAYAHLLDHAKPGRTTVCKKR
jgi:uncharacterized membrane protein YjdF